MIADEIMLYQDDGMCNRVGLPLLPLLVAMSPLPCRAQDASSLPAVEFRGEWTQFLASAVAGQGDDAPRYGGRLDGYAQVNGESAGLWNGLTINAQAEFVYGHNINRVGSGLVLPVNAALAFPKANGQAFDLSLNIVQKIGKLRFQAGKINLLDASTAIPIVGGGGKEGFMHLGLAAPPGLLASPKVFGAIVGVPVGRLTLNVGVWTPEDWDTRFDPAGIFKTGTNAMFAARLPLKIGGLRGFHTLNVYVTTRAVNGSVEYPDIRPPSGSGSLLPTKAGGTHLRYSIQQYLWQDPNNPARGWGLFGHIGISRGTPGILDWTMTAGFAGSVPIASRPLDRFGIGYFRLALTQRIIDGLEPVLPLRDEQGGELYYTVQVGRIARFTLDGQLLNPILARAPPVVNLSLRAKVDF
jgi:porin